MKLHSDNMLFDNQKTEPWEWLTTEEAAAYLRISVGSVRNMTSNGQVRCYKLYGRNRYRLEDLQSLHVAKGE